MTVDLGVLGVRVVDLQAIESASGGLVIAEFPKHLPFTVERFFALHDVPEGEVRGTHAHRECHQFLVCLTGSVTAGVDDGTATAELVLDRPTLGLYMPPLTWGKQYRYSPDAVLLVLASHPYEKDDYIEDYEEFKGLTARRGPV